MVAVSFIGGEIHRPAARHWQTLSHNVISSTPRPNGIRTHNVIDLWSDDIKDYDISIFCCIAMKAYLRSKNTKLEIYVFVTISGSTSLLVDY